MIRRFPNRATGQGEALAAYAECIGVGGALKTEVGKGFMRTAIGHELLDPKA